MTSRACWEVQAGVHSKHRKRGIGSALLTNIFDEMRSRGSGSCEAMIHAKNMASITMIRPFLQ